MAFKEKKKKYKVSFPILSPHSLIYFPCFKGSPDTVIHQSTVSKHLGAPETQMLSVPGNIQELLATVDMETHQDCQHRGPHGDVLVQADIVERLAEDGPVVVFIDEGNLHLGIAHVVRDTLIGKELGGQSRAA